MSATARIGNIRGPLDKGNVHAPLTVALGAAAAAITIYDKNIHGPLQLLELQNVGTGTVKVCINDDATALVYNRILAVDTGAGNGLGGTYSLGMGAHVTKVTLFSTAGSTVTGLLVTNAVDTRY